MIFRKHTWSFRSARILCLICLAGSLWSVTKVYPDPALSMLLMGISAAMILLFLFSPWNQMLQIDGHGIRCFRQERTLWVLAWDEIERIRPVTVNGCWGYALIPKEGRPKDLQIQESAPDYTVERTRRIADALEQYAPRLMETRR